MIPDNREFEDLHPQRPRSLPAQLLWLLRHRPGQVYNLGRGFLLFLVAKGVRRIAPPPGVVLGANVRLQRNGSTMAELPHARILVGSHSIIYEDAQIEAYAKGSVEIGEGSVIGDARIVSRYRVRIGPRFLSSWNVFIQDFDPHPVSQSLRALQVERMVHGFRPRFDRSPRPLLPGLDGWDFPGEEIHIGQDVWVGANATILKGASIGDGCIVAAGSVVLKGVYPPRSLLAGNPACVVRELAP
jgi:acetyltransferase-like isoleucine patch superfamily enzyme